MGMDEAPGLCPHLVLLNTLSGHVSAAKEQPADFLSPVTGPGLCVVNLQLDLQLRPDKT